MATNRGCVKRILLVDDDRGVADVCVQMLRHHGYDVATSESGEEAMDLFSKDYFDLVIMDIGLPGMDGLSCAKELRRRHNDIKIVLSSGSCSDTQKDGASSDDAFRLLQKPYTMQDLINTVGCMMESC